MAKKNLATVNTTNTKSTNTKKEENTMKNTVAKIALTNPTIGTITATQKGVGEPIILRLYNKFDKSEIATVVATLMRMGFEFESTDKVASPTPKESEKIGVASKSSKKTSTKQTKSSKQTKSTKKVEAKKPQTREEALTARYGSIEVRRERMRLRSQIWNEESARVTEEVRASGKYLRKDVWKKKVSERVNARLAEIDKH